MWQSQVQKDQFQCDRLNHPILLRGPCVDHHGQMPLGAATEAPRRRPRTNMEPWVEITTCDSPSTASEEEPPSIFDMFRRILNLERDFARFSQGWTGAVPSSPSCNDTLNGAAEDLRQTVKDLHQRVVTLEDSYDSTGLHHAEEQDTEECNLVSFVRGEVRRVAEHGERRLHKEVLFYAQRALQELKVSSSPEARSHDRDENLENRVQGALQSGLAFIDFDSSIKEELEVVRSGVQWCQDRESALKERVCHLDTQFSKLAIEQRRLSEAQQQNAGLVHSDSSMRQELTHVIEVVRKFESEHLGVQTKTWAQFDQLVVRTHELQKKTDQLYMDIAAVNQVLQQLQQKQSYSVLNEENVTCTRARNDQSWLQRAGHEKISLDEKSRSQCDETKPETPQSQNANDLVVLSKSVEQLRMKMEKEGFESQMEIQKQGMLFVELENTLKEVSASQRRDAAASAESTQKERAETRNEIQRLQSTILLCEERFNSSLAQVVEAIGGQATVKGTDLQEHVQRAFCSLSTASNQSSVASHAVEQIQSQLATERHERQEELAKQKEICDNVEACLNKVMVAQLRDAMQREQDLIEIRTEIRACESRSETSHELSDHRKDVLAEFRACESRSETGQELSELKKEMRMEIRACESQSEAGWELSELKKEVQAEVRACQSNGETGQDLSEIKREVRAEIRACESHSEAGQEISELKRNLRILTIGFDNVQTDLAVELKKREADRQMLIETQSLLKEGSQVKRDWKEEIQETQRSLEDWKGVLQQKKELCSMPDAQPLGPGVSTGLDDREALQSLKEENEKLAASLEKLRIQVGTERFERQADEQRQHSVTSWLEESLQQVEQAEKSGKRTIEQQVESTSQLRVQQVQFFENIESRLQAERRTNLSETQDYLESMRVNWEECTFSLKSALQEVRSILTSDQKGQTQTPGCLAKIEQAGSMCHNSIAAQRHQEFVSSCQELSAACADIRVREERRISPGNSSINSEITDALERVIGAVSVCSGAWEVDHRDCAELKSSVHNLVTKVEMLKTCMSGLSPEEAMGSQALRPLMWGMSAQEEQYDGFGPLYTIDELGQSSCSSVSSAAPASSLSSAQATPIPTPPTPPHTTHATYSCTGHQGLAVPQPLLSSAPLVCQTLDSQQYQIKHQQIPESASGGSQGPGRPMIVNHTSQRGPSPTRGGPSSTQYISHAQGSPEGPGRPMIVNRAPQRGPSPTQRGPSSAQYLRIDVQNPRRTI